jgi:hypothetical protein
LPSLLAAQSQPFSMPIRINLLAEQQNAEEMRRRDPVKRTLYVGVALVLLMLLWIGLTEINVSLARRELSGYETRLKSIEEQSKQARNNQTAINETDSKIKALEKYQRSRFFWGTFLNSIQETAVENVRLMEIRGDQRYLSGEANRFFTTNISVAAVSRPPAWKIWASAPRDKNVQTLALATLSTVTNKAPFTTNHLEYAIRVTPVSTNLNDNKITARVDFSTIPWASELITVDVRGRDYGNPPGSAVDDFAGRVASFDYFKRYLAPNEGVRFTERPPQARTDLSDSVNPNALFVPFTIQLGFKERIFNE